MYQNSKPFVFSRNNVLSQKGRRNGAGGAHTQGNVSQRGMTERDIAILNGSPNTINKLKINSEKDIESIQGFRTFR